MGGNAMSQYGASRITLEQKLTVLPSISQWALDKGVHKVAPVKELSDKLTFGDIDFVYTGSNGLTVSDRPYKRNGGVLSTVWVHSQGMVQVDFIKVPDKCYEFTHEYYSYNDMGNLLGRIASMLGFSLGHTGLYYKYTDKYGGQHKLLVTTDWQKAMGIIGYGSRPDSLDWVGMMSYVLSGDYFCTRPFLLENRDHKGRSRDRKRTSYNRFLQDIDARWGSHAYKLNDLAEVRSDVMHKAFKLKPSMLDAIGYIEAEQLLKRDARVKLNGTIVAEQTGLSGVALGKVMQILRQPGWEQWAVSATESEIILAIRGALESYNQTLSN